jgi:hypothetical protein
VTPPRPAWERLPLLLPAMLALVAGVLAGVWRLGAWPSAPESELPMRAVTSHGALMVCGFFGAVISLERAVALSGAARGHGVAWAWSAPLAAGLGTLLALAGSAAAALAWWMAAAVLAAATLHIWRRQREAFVGVLALGASSWAVGNTLLLAGSGVAQAVPWWLAFLVFTIAGERLELSRLVPRPPGARAAFAVILAGLVAALLLGLAGPTLDGAADTAQALFGGGLLALALWLLRHDLARRTVRQQGLVRYIALSLLTGFAWLAAGGLLLAAAALPGAGAAWRDAALHALLLGFVFSMVFGHAPIVMPAVLRIALPYRRHFHLPLWLLHASVALRVGAGLADWTAGRQAAAGGSALALAVFVATMVSAARGGRAKGLARGAAGAA